MSQYFKFLAPKKREVIRDFWRLEMVFNGQPRTLVRLLAVPTRRNKQDSRDGTKLKEQTPDNLKAVDTPGESLQTKLQIRPKLPSKSTSPERHDNTLEFTSLPPELHHAIFQVLDAEDMLSLSLTSRYFWAIGRTHLRKRFLSTMGRWAGEPIVCVGDYTDGGDNPPGLFTREEEEELGMGSTESFGRSVQLYRLSHDSSCIENIFPAEKLQRKFAMWTRQRMTLAQSDRDEMIDVLYPDMSFFYPEDEAWVLRNLTTKEYVRPDAVALRPEYIHGPIIKYLGFGEVVAMRISWTSDGDLGLLMDGDEDVNRGSWAGHRFDITVFEEKMEEDGWRDVSEETARRINELWTAEFDSHDWREELQCMNAY